MNLFNKSKCTILKGISIMNKNCFIILFLTLLLLDNFSSSPTYETKMGPSSYPFITMFNNTGSSGTPSSITLGNLIILGDGTNAVKIAASTSSGLIVWPTGSNPAILGLNSTGEIVTTVVTQLGSVGNNEILCPAVGNIQMLTTNNQNIDLSANGTGNINIKSGSINPVTGNNVLLSVDQSGNINTTDNTVAFLFGNTSTGNYITLDNSSGNAGINLNTSNVNQNITFNSGSGNIVLENSNIVAPISPYTIAMLGINSSNQVITLSPTSPGFFGNLTATGAVSLGTINSGTNVGNQFLLPTSGNVSLSAMGTGNIIFTSDTGNIQLLSSGITAPASGAPYVVLALDNNHNVITSNANDIFLFGSEGLDKNYIIVDNSGSTGITVNGILSLENSGFTKPATGYTAVLTVNSSGQVGITVSSEKYKSDIKSLDINDADFDKLEPVSYIYRRNESVKNPKREFGLIAEKLAKISSLADNVIYGEDGTPLSIDYNGVNIALIGQFIKFRKNTHTHFEQITTKLEKLEQELAFKNDKIVNLENKINYLLAQLQ